jgi:O-antigen/teichoic acid export membrane protein
MNQLKTGAVLSYVTIFLTNIVGLALTPFIIRSLGQSEYGLYILLGSLVGYISLLDFGLANTIVRFVAKYRANNDKEGEQNFLATILIIYIAISVLVVATGCIFYSNLETIFDKSLESDELEKAKTLMLLLIFNMTIVLPGGTFAGICTGYEKFIFPRFVNIIRYILRSVVVVVALLYGGKAISIVAIDTILNLVIILINMYYVFYVLKVKIKLKKIDKALIKTIFSYSMWIFVFAMIGELFWKSGQMILGITISTEAVAVFAVAITLSSYFGAFAGAINSVFLPRATNMLENRSNRKELTAFFVKIGRILTFLLLYIWGAFILFGKHFIVLWVGDAYSDAYLMSAIMMTAYILPLVQNFANSLIEASGQFKFKVKVYFTCISTGIILGAILVPRYGYWAITLSYSFFWIISQIIMNWYYEKTLNLDILYFFKNTFGKIFLFLFIAMGIGYLTNLYIEGDTWISFILKSLVYSLSYISLLVLFVLDPSEKQLLHKFKR